MNASPNVVSLSRPRLIGVALVVAGGLTALFFSLLTSAKPSLAAAVDVGVTKTASANPAVLGVPFNYTVVVTNGPVATDGPVTLTDTLPAGVSLNSVSATAGACPTASPVICTFPTLAANDTVTVTIGVTPTALGTLTNVAQVGLSAADTDTLTSNDVFTLTTSAIDQAIAGLTANNSSPTLLGAATNLTATITTGTNVTYQWNFGDGSALGSGATTTRTYPAAGNYTAIVTATNSVGSASTTTSVTVNNPVPSITTLTPSSATAGGGAFTLTVDGSNFVSGSTVRWNGAARTTTFVSSTQLTASIAAADIATAGTATVDVLNPTPGGGDSNDLTFTVNNPLPSVSGLGPASRTAGGPTFTLTVNGSNFVNGSVVRWNGSDRVTTFVSSTQITATLPASDITTAGNANVTVFNPAPGGGTSTPATTFTITPQPTLAINNVSVTEGNAPATVNAIFTVTLTGATDQPASVNYATANLTATAGSDYAATSGTLNFPVGTTTQTITVTVNGDALNEVDETFAVNLSGATLATISDAQGLGTIVDDDPQPTLTLSNASLTEGNSGSANMQFVATLNTPSGQTVSVDYATAAVTATAGVDFTSTSGTLTFTAGVVTQTISAPILGDVIDEVNETFVVNLSNRVNVSLGNMQATGTILDDDLPPNVFLNPATQTVTEAVGPVTVNVNLSVASSFTVTVPFTVSGTAAGGADHSLVAGTFTVAPGSTLGSVSFNVISDTVDEDDETVIVTLGAATNATPSNPSVQTITLQDDDAPPTISINDVTVTEGNSGTAAATFTLSLSTLSERTLTINYATQNNTALAPQDYVTASGTVTFTPGLPLTRTVTLTVNGDNVDEPNESFFVNLSSPNNVTVADGQGLGAITDDDPTPQAAFALGTFTVSEDSNGNTVASVALITVTLTNPSSVTGTVNYATSNGTAIAGADYVAASGTLTFAPGVTTQSFTITTIADALDDPGPDETITLTLSGPNAAIGLGTPNLATLNIVDNEGTPSIRFTLSTSTVAENAGSVNIGLTLSNPSSVPVNVTVTSSNLTAVAGLDYGAINQTAVISVGAVTGTLSVPITEDVIYELNETFLLTLSNPLNATPGGSNITHTVTISDNESLPTLQLPPGAIRVFGENRGPAVITVTLSTPSAFTTTVNYATANLTATAGSDYTALNDGLTFAPGVITRTIAVPFINEAVYEGNENFTLNLSGPVNAALGVTAPITLTIANDDPQAGCSIYSSANVPLTIPDNNPAGIESTLTLPGLTLTDLSVRIEGVLHTYVGDLRLTLIAPNGQSVTLMNNVGNGSHLLYTVFNDNAPTLAGVNAPFTGTFRPNSTLPALNRFVGTNAGGGWKLRVVDSADSDLGTLQAWGMEVCGSYKTFLPVVRR